MGYCPFSSVCRHREFSVATEKVGFFCDIVFRVTTRCTCQVYDRACMRATGLHARLGHTRDNAVHAHDKSARPHVATGFLCRDRNGLGLSDQGHDRVPWTLACWDKAPKWVELIESR